MELVTFSLPAQLAPGVGRHVPLYWSDHGHGITDPLSFAVTASVMSLSAHYLTKPTTHHRLFSVSSPPSQSLSVPAVYPLRTPLKSCSLLYIL